MSAYPPPLPAPLYQGAANTWECDEGGHLNVRFHVERAMSGLAHFANILEMPHAFTASAGATLVPLEAHIRFLKEARPGAPLSMHGAVTSFSESEAHLCLDMRHGDGAPSSSFNLRVAHADTRGFRPFPWSARSRAAADALMRPLPDHAKTRSIDLGKPPRADISRAAAEAAGAIRIGGAFVTPDQCDAFGRFRGEHFVGRISDSVTNLLTLWRQEIAARARDGGAAAGAVVEARIVFRRWPRAGNLIEIHSGIVEVGEKTMRLVHWLTDPESGQAWASMEAVALTFDTVTRKALAPSPEARAAMQEKLATLSV
ncbi:MAG: thioesterase family protein [Hyphomonadaceae bacterium]|nr:thioesterase family protein [Hyphomonadaceae bacterium]